MSLSNQQLIRIRLLKLYKSRQSLDQGFTLNEVIQVLVSSSLPSFLLYRCLNDISKLSTVEEGSCVFQNALWSVVQDLADKEPHEGLDLRVLSEVLFILYSQLELFLFDLVLLRADNALHTDQIVVVAEEVLPISSWLMHTSGNLFTVLLLEFLFLLLLVCKLLFFGHRYEIILNFIFL
ncbi:hypothetical protein FGO68_gene5876 [Halteria grandinella]|uniref:Uncharacterized protein n=1 Tax=Halteria grandinella TaxID=5974 RepID=A0A8J8T6M6_HALGN|nr:hypothetical protein FGO68_gene5876 [Halteria grandinella]